MTWQQDYINSLIPVVSTYPDYLGIAALGSYAYGDSDDFSDLDLLLIHDQKNSTITKSLKDIADSAGVLIASYGGGHIGKANLLICLYDNPVRRVDLTAVNLEKYIADQVQQPKIIDDPHGTLTEVADQIEGSYPPVNYQAIEDRFWVWIINCTRKIQRGDVFEALSYITSIRKNALLPLIHAATGSEPRGYRNLHIIAPEWERELRTTHPADLSQTELLRAVRAIMRLYDKLLDSLSVDVLMKNEVPKTAAESVVGN